MPLLDRNDDASCGDADPLLGQIRAVVAGLKALSDAIDTRHAQAAGLNSLVRADLAAVRQNHKDLEEKLDCVICVMQHDLESLRQQARTSERCTAELTRAVHALRRPVAEIAALRSRFAGILFTLGVLGTLVLWLAEPLYRRMIDRIHF